MTPRCVTRGCERAPFDGIALCRECAERLVGRTPEPFVPVWRRRVPRGKDLSGHLRSVA